MQNQHMIPVGRFSAMLSLVMLVAACAGGGAPTPPGAIGNTPPSILESLPPADGSTDGSDPFGSPGLTDNSDQTGMSGQTADTAMTDPSLAGLPPATSIPTTANPAPTQTAIYQAPASRAVLTFEPMVGAPDRVARELATALGMRVAQQALPVVKRTDSKVTHRIKGYFSASKSGSECVVSYVWDIFDAKGKRVNRVTGTQKTQMVSSDPWDSVTGPVLDKVATDTAAKIKTWHASI